MDIVTVFVLYFGGFALIHSILATDYIKGKAEKIFRERFPFYRILYSILSVITFAPAFYIWIKYAGSTSLVYSIPQWLYPLVIFIRLAGIGLLVYAFVQTGILEFMGIRQLVEKPAVSGNVLVTKRAYGMVRHPIYTGGILVLFTKIDMTILDFTAVVLISVYLIVGAFIEEKRLLREFGGNYRLYQQQVSMFIPIKWILKKVGR